MEQQLHDANSNNHAMAATNKQLEQQKQSLSEQLQTAQQACQEAQKQLQEQQAAFEEESASMHNLASRHKEERASLEKDKQNLDASNQELLRTAEVGLLNVFGKLFCCPPAAAVDYCLPMLVSLCKLLPTYGLQRRQLLLSGRSVNFAELCCLLIRRAYYAAANGRQAATSPDLASKPAILFCVSNQSNCKGSAAAMLLLLCIVCLKSHSVLFVLSVVAW